MYKIFIDTNILLDFYRINNQNSINQVLKDIRQELDYDDLGKTFYKRLTSVYPYKLIDFEEPKNNDYHCTAEFTCERDGENFIHTIVLNYQENEELKALMDFLISLLMNGQVKL